METKSAKETSAPTSVTSAAAAGAAAGVQAVSKAPQKKEPKEPERKESKPSNISISLEATQFNFGDTSFAGQEAKMVRRDEDGKVIAYDPATDEAPFVMVPYNGGELKVDAGSWLVSFPDGTKQVWSDTQHEQWTGGNGVTDPFTGPIWRDSNYKVNYPQPGRANPNELLEDGSTTYPGHPDNPVESVIPPAPDNAGQKTKK